ncbi:hypothetical protein OCS97_004155 [Clostridioides difficile]|nr:hypothetical protein [Clostridioides difficile]
MVIISVDTVDKHDKNCVYCIYILWIRRVYRGKISIYCGYGVC